MIPCYELIYFSTYSIYSYPQVSWRLLIPVTKYIHNTICQPFASQNYKQTIHSFGHRKKSLNQLQLYFQKWKEIGPHKSGCSSFITEYTIMFVGAYTSIVC